MNLRNFLLVVFLPLSLCACQTTALKLPTKKSKNQVATNPLAPFGEPNPVKIETAQAAVQTDQATKTKVDETKLSFANATDATAAATAVQDQAQGSKTTPTAPKAAKKPVNPLMALLFPRSQKVQQPAKAVEPPKPVVEEVKQPEPAATPKPVDLPKAVVAKVEKPKKRKKKLGTVAAGRIKYGPIIAKHARSEGVPVKLAMAVVEVESSYRPKSTGRAGEIGLMQLLPRTARFIGYKGSMRDLYNPDTNIRYGMKYLGKAHKLGGGSVCGTILKYNAGHGAKRMNPISREYCRRIRKIMRRS